MSLPCGNFLLWASLAAMAATPALAQSTASVPDLSRLWANTLGPGFPPPASGPGPVLNKARQKALVDIYGRDIDPAKAPIVSAGGRRVGDYTAPILQPWAAQIVKAHAEKELNDGPALNPINQCRPSGVPFAFYNLGMELLQQRDSITILYSFDHEFRQLRLNQTHPAKVTPTWFGDSVGHFEGDTLVVDTVGIKTGPYTMVDQFGTPHTDKLHLVERYRLIDYDAANRILERGAKENATTLRNDSGVNPDLNNRGKNLELDFTVEDEGAFTTPWSSTIIYRPGIGRGTSTEFPEDVCAENPNEMTRQAALPVADRPDF